MNRRSATVGHGLAVALALAMLASLVAASARAADTLEAIELRYRLAEDLIPVLQPLVPPGAALTGTGDVLLVRADAATVRQIRTALETLDRAPRQLLITVGQGSAATRESAGVRGSATAGSDDVQVGVNRPSGSDESAQVTVQGHRTRDDVRSVSSIRTLEGHEAYVAIGESRPFTTTTVVGDGYHGPMYGQETQYRDVRTGFYATPRLSGDRVVLEISPVQQRASGGGNNAAVQTQGLTTTVSGRLGEWIELGGVTDQRTGSQGGLIRWGTRSASSQYSAWVKVDQIGQPRN